MMLPKPKRKKFKPEPVTKIQLQENKECWVCGTTIGLSPHHAMQGRGRRQLSDKYGLVVWLCDRHHTQNVPGDRGIHHNPKLRGRLQRLAQREFEKVYDREKWMKVFGRNYL